MDLRIYMFHIKHTSAIRIYIYIYIYIYIFVLFSSIFPEIKTRVLNWEGRKELFLFNDTLNTLYLRLDGVGHMVKDHSDSEREETRYSHIGYSFRLAARVLLYASSHRQDNTYHGLCYTSRGPLAGTRNSSMAPPHEGSIR